MLVIENDSDAVAKLKSQGIEAIAGNAADPEVIAAANLAQARCLLVAVPDAFEGGQIVEQARTHQSAIAHSCALAFAGRERASDAARRNPRDHGRARDREGDACRHREAARYGLRVDTSCFA